MAGGVFPDACILSHVATLTDARVAACFRSTISGSVELLDLLELAPFSDTAVLLLPGDGFRFLVENGMENALHHLFCPQRQSSW